MPSRGSGVVFCEVPRFKEKAAGGTAALAARRRAAREELIGRSGPRVEHTFRHLHQASCYWLEGLSWVGESWGDLPPARVPAPVRPRGASRCG